MLGKLIKYDLKSIYKYLLAFYGIALISAIIARLTADSSNFILKFVHEFTQGCVYGFSIGVFINTNLRAWSRLQLSFYGNESYLTHTLPVRRQTLLSAKFLSGIIVILTNVLIGLASFLILFYTKDFVTAWHLDDPTTRTFYFLFALTALFQLIYILQSGFLGIFLGHLHNNNRRVLSIIYGIAIYYIGGMVILGIIALWSLLTPELSAMIWHNATLDPAIMNQLLIGFSLIYLVLISIAYCVNRKLLKNGINVD